MRRYCTFSIVSTQLLSTIKKSMQVRYRVCFYIVQVDSEECGLVISNLQYSVVFLLRGLWWYHKWYPTSMLCICWWLDPYMCV